MLIVKQGSIKYHFLSLWYDLTWDWTKVSRAIGKHSNHYANIQYKWGCPHGVMVKVMDCKIVVSEFEFQLRYYVHFRINTLGKGMNPLILPAVG